jgi:hypothetical protein
MNTPNRILPLIFAVLFLHLTGLIVHGQTYGSNYKSFQYGNFFYEIKIKPDTAGNSKKTYILQVNKGDSAKHTLQKEIQLNIPNKSLDFVTFGAYINKKRKFILIKGSNHFALLNLYNHQLSGFYKPVFHGTAQDAQSRMLSGLKIILNGRAVIGYCVDSGVFMYDFTNFYRGKELSPVSNPLSANNKVYILKHLPEKNESFGIFLSSQNWETNYRFLFFNKTVDYKSHPPYNQNMRFEEKEKYMTNNQTETKYTLIKELLPHNAPRWIIIENHTGEIIQLPKYIESAERDMVLTYLSNN